MRVHGFGVTSPWRSAVVKSFRSGLKQPECIAVARLAADAEVETLKRYHEILPELPPCEVSGALRNVSTTKGINIQRARELRGEPTVIRHEKQSAAELWAEFCAMFPSVVDGAAIEIPAEIEAPD